MMIRNRLAALLLGAATLAATGTAQAVMIAGWDFSQYLSAGVLTTDGVNPAQTLTANYSQLDPTIAVAPEWLATTASTVPNPNFVEYGRLHYDGLFGSTNVPVTGTGDEIFRPNAGSLLSNQTQPSGAVPFDSLALLQLEGQEFINPLTMVAAAPVSVVFEIDTALFGAPGATAWEIDLAGATLSGTAQIGVEFSTDGIGYAPVTTFNLTTTDTPFSAILPNILSSTAYVRLNFTNASGNNFPLIDNVGISANVIPEPGTLVLLGSGLAGLVLSGRRRA